MTVTNSQFGNHTPNYIEGTVTAVEEAITLTRLMTTGYTSIQLTGTWAGTVTFECTSGRGTSPTWVTINMHPSTGTDTVVTTSTGNGMWWTPSIGFAQIRARFSTATSGTLGVTINTLQSKF